ncbi:unnamed protein product [Camellia sinensis]
MACLLGSTALSVMVFLVGVQSLSLQDLTKLHLLFRGFAADCDGEWSFFRPKRPRKNFAALPINQWCQRKRSGEVRLERDERGEFAKQGLSEIVWAAEGGGEEGGVYQKHARGRTHRGGFRDIVVYQKTMMKKSLFIPHLQSFSQTQSLHRNTFINLFSSTTSTSLAITDVETKLRSLCEEPTSQFTDAVSLFTQSINSSLIPSGSTCNFLVTLLTKSKQYNSALKVYALMTRVEVSSSFLTLTAVIECFVHAYKPEFGIGVLGLLIKRGFSANTYVVNVLLKGLCRKGEVFKAMELFRELGRNCLSPDVVSFNTLINGLCKVKKLEEAMDLRGEMEGVNCIPSLVTYSTLMDGLCKVGRVNEAMGLLEEMRVKGIDADVVVYGTLISGFCHKGNDDDDDYVIRGKELFDEMLGKGISPNVITYTCLINGLCKIGQWKEATQVFDEMTERGIRPDAVTYTGLIDGLCKDGRATKAVELFNLMLEKGEEPSIMTYNVLICGLCKAGLVMDGFRILELMMAKGKKPDVVIYTNLASGFYANGKADKVMVFFDLMLQDQNIVELEGWKLSVLIQGLCKQGRLDEALEIHRKMVESRSITNMVPYNMLIGACLKAGNVEKAMGLWKQVLQLGLVPDSFTYSVTINGFCKLHLVNIAKGFFIQMRAYGHNPTLFDYNTLMATLCKDSSLEQAKRLFHEMKSTNCEPDVASFNTIINGTLKAGDIQSAKQLLMDMHQRGLAPDALTFSVLINRFCKLGQLEDAKSVFERMIACGFTPDAFVYDSLLKGFCSRGEKEEFINLLRKMAAKGVVLDSEITSTILECICHISEDLNIMELLPSFSQQPSEGLSITCNELLIIYTVVCKQIWYSPDMCFFRDMLMMMLARNKIADEAKQVWEDLKRKVLYDQHTFGDIIRAFLDSGLPSKAMDICNEMRQSGSFSQKWLFMTPLNAGLTINIGKGRVKRNGECCKFTVIS